ncbi:hypothetical protein ACD631_21095 (plasmid) [Alteromonas macleodii]|uniref:hypothetical protein n=1 Tax=Alteromonas macleodii TaxID=28108 RepID=UPI00207676FC|nr:hypothetical protein [Alteromonas macleodii]USI30269.1 hypothetical protein NFG60_20945 [Alteromonas macleodii]
MREVQELQLSVISENSELFARSKNSGTLSNNSKELRNSVTTSNPLYVIENKSFKVKFYVNESLSSTCDNTRITKAISEIKRLTTGAGSRLNHNMSIELVFVANVEFDYRDRLSVNYDEVNYKYLYPITECNDLEKQLHHAYFMVLHEAYHADFFLSKFSFVADEYQNEWFATLFANCDSWSSEAITELDFSEELARLNKAGASDLYAYSSIIGKLIKDTNKQTFLKHEIRKVYRWCELESKKIPR